MEIALPHLGTRRITLDLTRFPRSTGCWKNLYNFLGGRLHRVAADFARDQRLTVLELFSVHRIFRFTSHCDDFPAGDILDKNN